MNATSPVTLTPRVEGIARRPHTLPPMTRLAQASPNPDPPVQQYTPSPFFSGSDRSNFPGPLESSFVYSGGNRADFYRFLRDRLPIVSAGIWSWVHLCSTPLERKITGAKYAMRDAEKILDALEQRLLPYPGRLALDRLTEALFWDLFTLGRCAAEVVPTSASRFAMTGWTVSLLMVCESGGSNFSSTGFSW